MYCPGPLTFIIHNMYKSMTPFVTAINICDSLNKYYSNYMGKIRHYFFPLISYNNRNMDIKF